MKKRIALLVAALLAVGSLTACGGDTNSGNSGNNGGDAAGTGTVTVGLGASTDFAYGSHSIGDEVYGQAVTETTAQADIHVAAVMLDADGKIVQCVIDAVQVGAKVNENGEMTTDPATTFKTKVELGSDYGMASASPIGKEWDAQALAFAQWCVGKTADEVAAGTGAEGYPTDEVLLTGCTIKTSEIVAAVVDACEKATATGASADDTLGLGMTAELSSYAAPSTDEATGEPVDGKVQAYVNYATTTQNAEGKITCVLIDSIQATSTWDATGILTTDMESEVLTKYEKQYDYGMVPASSIGKEWFEQIDVFKQFITGKTADEVTAIAVDESGYPTDETLTTGCTMKVAAYKTAVVKSLAK